jgi:hypothetical protein
MVQNSARQDIFFEYILRTPFEANAHRKIGPVCLKEQNKR